MEFENDIRYTFKKPTDVYAINMDPIIGYQAQLKKYITTKFKLNDKDAMLYLKEAIKENKPVNPKVTLNKKNEYGDMERVEDNLRDYLKDTIENKELIVPSFTVYNHPSVKKSLHSEFLFINVKKRSEDKHKAFEYKQANNKPMELYYSTMQKIRKIFNNAVSGAYGSKGSILSNPSGHYTLTSITRCVASIGNMTTESMIAGNKYFKNSNVTINYILAVIANISVNAIDRCIRKFDLHIPTPNELMDMILFSSRWYWENVEDEKIIFELLSSLGAEERCAVMYCNDLWHLKEYNDKLMREIIIEMGTIDYDCSDNPIGDIKRAPEGVVNLTQCICSEHIRGMKVDYGKLEGKPELKILGSTALKIMKAMDKYFLLFKVFYTTDVMPTSVAYIRDMLRDAIVLSDTDSTCGSYDKWLEWYYGKPMFNAEAIGIANAVMTINTQVMDHHIKLFAANMNIDKSMYETLKMKNEFYWSVFIATNVSKHYFAYTEIQEGNVFDESELELKGVHLIASTIKVEIKKMIHDIMVELLKGIKEEGEVSLKKYISKTVDLEMKIVNAIKSGDISFFKRIPIKGAKSYKQGPDSSPYQYHTLWEDIFSEKYGSLGEPPYMFVKIPLSIDNKTDMNEFLESIADEDIKNKFKAFFVKKNLSKYNTFRIPMDIVSQKGLPEEILDVVSVSRIIDDSLYSLYMVLETLGFYRKPGLHLYQQGYLES